MTRTGAMFIGDSVWRDAPRALSAAQAWTLAQELQTELNTDPKRCLKVGIESYDDARAVLTSIKAADRRRLLFAPTVPFTVSCGGVT
jgi:hypothetical protein